MNITFQATQTQVVLAAIIISLPLYAIIAGITKRIIVSKTKCDGKPWCNSGMSCEHPHFIIWWLWPLSIIVSIILATVWIIYMVFLSVPYKFASGHKRNEN